MSKVSLIIRDTVKVTRERKQKGLSGCGMRYMGKVWVDLGLRG